MGISSLISSASSGLAVLGGISNTTNTATTTSSSVYVNLGGTFTFTAPASGTVKVSLKGTVDRVANMMLSFALSGASSLAAADTRATLGTAGTGGAGNPGSDIFVSGLTPGGVYTVQPQYKSAAGTAAGFLSYSILVEG